ncbi:hypothetical protein PTSG_05931 [Salpingoeca rosetta]|uniref:Ribosomal protein S21 n=1 Tax=Salpingoeca rosetta (strain ATCC 50818 / BSB-021) TaxID=946362 RepID=F2UD72_SALR5|nr:uncharacterized protein PTSG_05931 [Salpingoeca rosetta]EGD74567.1 hypothetical protein PTSG_05931 [Salpingoeca rosetta]|eukprot:XP_004992824.1 hypothetical protein PTSG_05931 [Salpingoeca rosetta]
MRHPRFVANTVRLAVAKRPEDALTALSKITRGLKNNGVISSLIGRKRYTPPFERRRQEENAACVRIYQREFKKKVNLYFEMHPEKRGSQMGK